MRPWQACQVGGNGASAKRAFTLIELLVVVGIIAILLSILLPTLNKARRGAIVLTSPVVYYGSDKSIRLTDPQGKSDLLIGKMTTNGCPVCHSPPAWSPTGTTIAYTVPANATGTTYRVAILNPVSKQVTSWANDGAFIGWLDSERYVQSLQSRPDNAYAVNVKTGAAAQVNVIAGTFNGFEFFGPSPPSSPGRFIGMYYMPPANGARARDVIAFFRKDLGPGKVIWDEPRTPGSSPPQSQVLPRVDPLGEFVGWTIFRSGRPYVAYKRAGEPAWRPPELYGGAWPSAYFCDFTEQGEILANVKIASTGKFRLVVLHRDGTLNRELGTEVTPMEGVVASWRKYEHR